MNSKLLIVTPGFYPAKTYGGPVTSLYNLMNALSAFFDFYVVTSDHELSDSTRLKGIDPGWNDKGFAKIMYVPDAGMSLSFFSDLLREIKPDCIYLNAPYHRRTTPKLLFLSRKFGIRTILATRGGLNSNAISYGKVKKKLYLRLLKTFFGKKTILQSTSSEETLAVKKNYPRTEVREIPNMPKIPVFDGIPPKKKKEKGSVRIIYVSRILPIKNLLFALKAIKNVRADVSFDIFGPIESNEYWKLCRNYIDSELPPNASVHYKGYLDKEDMRNVYSGYDLFILPTESENFGHAIAEALYEKCPVLISDNTPWNDVNDYGVGRALPLNEMQGFTDYIECVARMDETELRAVNDSIPGYLKKHFNYEAITGQYISLFNGK